jgi:uncharacterized protein YbjT (DUF2867 family)
MRLLVTGGSGALGSKLVPRLAARGHAVRVLTRGNRKIVGAESVAGDLLDMRGVEAAVIGAECVVHCASSPRDETQKVDVEGTKHLVELAWRAGVRHFVYVSIAGVDRLPEYRYYRMKQEAEQVVSEGGIPWTILRATQFHGFIDHLFRRSATYPVMVIPRGWKSQPVEVGEVANRLVQAVADGPRRMLAEFGGPEVLTADEMAATWRRANNQTRPLLSLPVPGKMSAGLKSGAITCPDQRFGKITWQQFLAGARG